jgi:PTH2 family peptidyl-tRNA hydrolase
MAFKQVILVRKDLNLPKGKMSAQCCHASVRAVLKSDKRKVNMWDAEGAKKIVLKVKDLKELNTYFKKAKQAKMKTAIITDAGLTTIAPGTTTCMAIGPDEENKIDKITGKLPLM